MTYVVAQGKVVLGIRSS